MYVSALSLHLVRVRSPKITKVGHIMGAASLRRIVVVDMAVRSSKAAAASWAVIDRVFHGLIQICRSNN
jgi:hypothetical protein